MQADVLFSDIFQAESPDLKGNLQSKVSGSTSEDVAQLARLLEAHFNAPEPAVPHDGAEDAEADPAADAGAEDQSHAAAPAHHSYRGGGYNNQRYHSHGGHHGGYRGKPYYNNYDPNYHYNQQHHYSQKYHNGYNSYHHSPRGYQPRGGGGYRGGRGRGGYNDYNNYYQPRGGYRGGRGRGGAADYQPRGGRGFQPRAGFRGGRARGAPRGKPPHQKEGAAAVQIPEVSANATSEC